MTTHKIERLGLHGRYPNVRYLTMRRKELVLQVTAHHSIDASKIFRVRCEECEGKIAEIDQIKLYSRRLATGPGMIYDEITKRYACELHEEVTADNVLAIRRHQKDSHEANPRIAL